MIESRYLPEASRVSVLLALILLSLALVHIIDIPDNNLAITLPGLVLNIPFSLDTLLTALIAGLAASGTGWLLSSHPSLEKGEALEHWLLPTLTTLVLSLTLSTLSGRLWWLGFGLGLFFLLAVFLAEYIVVDHTDFRYPAATAILTALAFTIFLVLAIALRAAAVRLFLLAPALFVGSFLVALRTLHLRLNERWEPGWALGIALVGMQLGAALHYWPLSPVRYGLALLAPVYALTVLAVSLADGLSIRRAAAEPAVMLALLGSLLLLFR